MKPAFSWQYQEEELIEAEAVPIGDRGFRYGMSVFETILLHRGRAVLAPDHLERLYRAAAAAGFLMPSGLADALARRTAGFGESFSGMMRVYVTAGEGGPLAPAEESRIYVFVEDAALPSVAERDRGWRLQVSRAPIVPVLGGWKTGNYWPHIQALADARQNGCDESVLLDLSGSVISASMANLFALIDGELRTPPLMLGARDGVLRDWVLNNSDACEAVVTVDDLSRATECFLTNSRIGILPVRVIDGRGLPSQSTGRLLYDSYRENVLGS